MVSIITTGHDVADARLHRTAAALRRAGASVRIHGLGDAARGPEGCAVVGASKVDKVRRGLRAVAWPWRIGGADIVITTDPDTALSAFFATRLHRVAWVADVHEDYKALLEDRPWVPPVLRAALRTAVELMNQLIAKADLVVAADDHVPPVRASRRIVMRNEPEFSMLPEVRAHREDGPWRAVHIGDNRTSRGLRTMVEAVAGTVNDQCPWHLDIVGAVAKVDRPWFTQRMLEHDARHITHHGRLGPVDSWAIAAGADVGLCLLDPTPAFVDAMPSKVYEYLGCGLPTVATPLPRVVELLHRTGAGTIVDGAQETTAALRQFRDDEAWRSVLVAAAQEVAHVVRERPNTYDSAVQRILAVAEGNWNPQPRKL